ncbi:MAG: hypothetical protein KDB74_01470 [Flavobacteriales bacterium]|nr:hypothetical protein [Flavobacteriales bacterium]
MISSFIAAKSDQNLPDYYKVKICFIDGTNTDLTIVEHYYNKDLHIFDVRTKDDLIHSFSLYTVKSIEFDKNWSKIVEIRSKSSKQ